MYQSIDRSIDLSIYRSIHPFIYVSKMRIHTSRYTHTQARVWACVGVCGPVRACVRACARVCVCMRSSPGLVDRLRPWPCARHSWSLAAQRVAFDSGYCGP